MITAPYDPPIQDALLPTLADAKVGEQHQEHEQVVDRERLFDEVGDQVRERRILALARVHEQAEQPANQHEEDAADGGFAKRDVILVGAPEGQPINPERAHDDAHESCPVGRGRSEVHL
ncbi:MAG: hypothetical protein QM773_10455 [Hyphomonadaceae bacterium]